MDLNQVTLPAANIADSVAFYRSMGFEVVVSSPHYARFKSLVGDSTFSVHAAAARVTGPAVTVYFECEDIDGQFEKLRLKGLNFLHEPLDQPWLWREARLEDPSGNVICLYYAGENRLYPPWRVNR